MMRIRRSGLGRESPASSSWEDEYFLGGGGGGGSWIESRQPLSKRLNALKISLNLAGSGGSESSKKGSCIQIDCAVGGEHKLSLECSPQEMHLPVSVSEARSLQANDRDYVIPPRILESLRQQLGDSNLPLWLSFPVPAGYLPGLPWERMLRAALPNPSILRLSYQTIQPITPRSSRDILVCFSFARAKETYLRIPAGQIFASFFENIPSNIAAYSAFHVFTDSELFAHAVALRDRSQGTYKIELYDPQSSALERPAESSDLSGDDPIDNPWLLWMRDALGTRSVDVAHFVTHGFLGRQDGLLAFSESPLANDDRGTARFVGGRQVCAFLDQVGAWSAAFSSPPGNYSILGLRMLQDQIARARPGPVLFHDMAADADNAGLNEAYQFAYAVEEAFPPMSTAVNLSCHPEWAMPWTEGDTESRRLLDDLTLAGRIPDVLEGPSNTPSWLASGQRALETSLAHLLAESPGNTERVRDSGAAEALRFTADLLQRHAMKMMSGMK